MQVNIKANTAAGAVYRLKASPPEFRGLLSRKSLTTAPSERVSMNAAQNIPRVINGVSNLILVFDVTLQEAELTVQADRVFCDLYAANGSPEI